MLMPDGGSSLKPAAQQLQSAALLTGADEPGVHDGGVVHRQHPGRAAVGLLVLDGPFIPGWGGGAGRAVSARQSTTGT